MKIAIADLGIGNLRSVEHAVASVASAAEVVVTHDAREIAAADKLILPGQGAVGTWFEQVDQRGLREVLEVARCEKPVFGICVGMQAMFEHCAEDNVGEALGWVAGEVQHFKHQLDENSRLKIPHMGWNKVQQFEHPLWHKIEDHSHFYFVHSYCGVLNRTQPQAEVVGTAEYGAEFIAAVAFENVFATQFHPEKSHADGLQLLRNFIVWDGGW